MQSSRLKKSSISSLICLNEDEQAQLKAYIIVENLKHEEVKVDESGEEGEKKLTNFEKIAKAEFDKTKSSTVFEYPSEAQWRGHHKSKERLHCWNVSKFVRL